MTSYSPLAWVSSLIPKSYYTRAYILLWLNRAAYIWANGRNNTHHQKIHGRTVLITGELAPMNMTIFLDLARRGAHIIFLTPSPEADKELISSIRKATSNDLIFAEECDLTSPTSIRSFCQRFLTTSTSSLAHNLSGANHDPPKLDTILLAHEYMHIGAFQLWGKPNPVNERMRSEGGLASFLLLKLLLPCLMEAPTSRDIRIVSVVNPLYAASVPTYISPLSPPQPIGIPSHPETPILQDCIARFMLAFTSLSEGHRALRSILLMRHLQRIVDARAAHPRNFYGGISQCRSNIIAVSASPGFSGAETVTPFLGGKKGAEGFWLIGLWACLLLSPLILTFAKDQTGAAQTVLYAILAPSGSRVETVPEFIRHLLWLVDLNISRPGRPCCLDRIRPVQLMQRFQGGLLYRECQPTQLPGRGAALMEDEAVGKALWNEMEQAVEAWEKQEGEALKRSAHEAGEKLKQWERLTRVQTTSD